MRPTETVREQHDGVAAIDPWELYRDTFDLIDGWFQWDSTSLFRSVDIIQSDNHWPGSLLEIGLYHGKSFASLCLLGDSVVGIDTFTDAVHERFEATMRHLGLTDRYTLLRKSSVEVAQTDELLDDFGLFRFIHIDGDHGPGATICDLDLSDAICARGAVIAVDDVFNPAWPAVSEDVHNWLNINHANNQDNDNHWKPFAIGFGKVFLCRAACYDCYYEAFKTSEPVPTSGGRWHHTSTLLYKNLGMA